MGEKNINSAPTTEDAMPQQHEQESGVAEVTGMADRALDELREFVALPETDDYSTGTERPTNALFKGVGLLLTAVGARHGLNSESLSSMAEAATITGVGFSNLLAAYLHGKIVNRSVRERRSWSSTE